jgi:LysM domain
MLRRLRSLGALALLLAIAIGIPAVLVAIAHWPLPHHVPNWSRVWVALQQGDIQAAVVIKVIATLLWLAWAQLVWALAWELAVNVPSKSHGTKQRRAPLVPTSIGLGMGRLVAMAFAASLITTAVTSAPALARSSASLPTTPDLPTATLVATSPEARAEARQTCWVFSAGDSLWSIAQASLGDGSRVGDILELNPSIESPRNIRPGHILQLPNDAEVPENRRPQAPSSSAFNQTAAPEQSVVPEADPIAAARSVEVQTGDNLWGMIEKVAGTTTPEDVAAVAQANDGAVSPDGAVFHAADPSMINPGQRFNLVPAAELHGMVPTPAPVAAPEAVKPVEHAPALLPPPPATVAAVTVAPALPPVTHEDGHLPAPAVHASIATPDIGVDPEVTAAWTTVRKAIGLSGATLLATGIGVALQLRRRRRLRSMGPNHRLPDPHPAIAEMAATIRATADASAISRLDLALRALATVFTASDAAAPVVFDSAADLPWRVDFPQPRAVLVRASGDIDIALDRATTVTAAPFVSLEEGRVFRVPASVATVDLASVGATVPSPCPALTMIGTCELDGSPAEVYLNLEELGGLTVIGPVAEEVDDVLRALTASLAMGALGDGLHVFVDGLALGTFADTTSIDTEAGIVGASQSAAELVAGRQQFGADVSGFVLRATQPEEVWDVAVVVAGSSADAHTPELALVACTKGVVVLSAAPIEGLTTSLQATDQGWLLTPFNLAVTPVALAEPALDAIGEVLEEASVPPEVVAAPELRPEVEVEPFIEPKWNFLVHVLGPIHVMSALNDEVEFERTKALELVVWLAQHRGNPSRVLARTALWEVNVQDATFANVVSDARRSLGRAIAPADGYDWIARNSGDRIPLHESILTDVELVQARLDWARQIDGQAAIDALRPAVALLRDQPYSGTDYLWPDDDALPSGLTHLATSTAVELAQRCLDAGDIDGVLSASAVGLRILPGHDELVCLRMRAHHQLGSSAGVRSEYAAYERVVLSDGDGESDPSPRVAGLRKQLLTTI